MSQVGVSRPMTQQSMVGRLPEIRHPLSRMSNPENLDIRGVSRAGGERPTDLHSSHGRPLPAEHNYQAPHRYSMGSSRGKVGRSLPEAPMNYETIPEWAEVTHGDPRKPRIPIFGSRAEVASRADVQSRISSRLSKASSQQRLEIDELESILREKIQNNFYELKKNFKANDPEQKGTVSRDALFRILITITNRPINQGQFTRLMDRFGLKDKIAIHYSEFFALFRDVQSADYPRWIDPVQRHWQERGSLTASQVHVLLKEKAKGTRTISDLLPQVSADGSKFILKPEFRTVLSRLGFSMSDDEFEKLWSKYDVNCLGTISGEQLMKKLGAATETNSPQPQTTSARGEAHGLRKKEMERQRSLNIERWLKDKFREGFLQMKQTFKSYDKQKTGMISHDDFLKVLADYGLRLDKTHLGDFLARCSVSPTKTSVPYKEFLHRFQDRSEAGMTHNILTNPKHSYNRPESPDAESTFSALETQLLNMFQRDFLALLGTFHKIDKLGLDVISQEEFRAAVESRFDIEMTDDQFAAFIDRVPLDAEGNVRYADFMAQFDTRGKAKSLYTEATEPRYRPVNALPENKTPVPSPETRSPPPEHTDPVDQMQIMPDNDDYLGDLPTKRSTFELFKIIKELMKKNFQKLQDAFYEIDELNTRRLSQETMYHLMKKLDIKPEITRGEIRELWKTFITNQDKTLDFLQFVRHFGYSLRSAAFPNAKQTPPRRGDSDFLIRSRKLNCAADMLQDNLRAKIDYMWDDLRREFLAMDPYGTGCVMVDEFREVLSELCVHLNDYELDLLCKRFQIKGDGRVSYIEFLKPFALKRQTWRHGNNMLALLQHPNTDMLPPQQRNMMGLTDKLRQKLVNDWKSLRRAFKKLDVSRQGYLTVSQFRSVLKNANITLNEEEIYQLLSAFDENMTGKIPYNKFLSETFRPVTQQDRLAGQADLLF